MSTGASQVLIEGDPQSLFGAFLVTQKGTRPAGRNSSPKKFSSPCRRAGPRHADVTITETMTSTITFTVTVTRPLSAQSRTPIPPFSFPEAKRSFAGSSLPSFLSRKRGETKFRRKFFAKLSFKKAGRNEVSHKVLLPTFLSRKAGGPSERRPVSYFLFFL